MKRLWFGVLWYYESCDYKLNYMLYVTWNLSHSIQWYSVTFCKWSEERSWICSVVWYLVASGISPGETSLYKQNHTEGWEHPCVHVFISYSPNYIVRSIRKNQSADNLHGNHRFVWWTHLVVCWKPFTSASS
jgi:hypothetical protein